MEPTKPMIIGAFAAGGTSFIAGTALAGSSGSHAGAVTLQNPFLDIDLNCVAKNERNPNQKGYFFTLKGELVDENNGNIKTRVRDSQEALQFNLPKPSTASGKLEGCLRITNNQYETTPKAVVSTIEMTASKDNYGIILMNVITNMEKYGGPTSVYRALFLEKKTKWEIKGGVEWYDASFPSNVSGAKKLQFKRPNTNHDVDWENGGPKDYKYSHLWKSNESKSTNIFQELTIKINGADPAKPLDFWNGKAEPLQETSNVSKPSAFYEVKGKTWQKAKKDCCKDLRNTVKAWFDLFKDDRGTWG